MPSDGERERIPRLGCRLLGHEFPRHETGNVNECRRCGYVHGPFEPILGDVRRPSFWQLLLRVIYYRLKLASARWRLRRRD